MIRFFSIFLLLTYCLSAVEINSTSEKFDHFPIYMFSDIRIKQDIQTISEAHFTHRINSRFTLGYHANVPYWFKIPIVNDGKERSLILYFTNLFAHDFTFYYKKDGHWQQFEEGYAAKPDQIGIISDRNPKLTILLQPNEKIDIYVRIKSGFSIAGEFLFFSDNYALLNYNIYYSYWIVFFFGALFFVIAFNILLFIVLHSKLYGYYSAYLIFFGLFVFITSGMINTFGMSSWVQRINSLVPLSLIFYMLFADEMFELKKAIPYMGKVVFIISLMLVFLSIMINVSLYPWYMIFNLSRE